MTTYKSDEEVTKEFENKFQSMLFKNDEPEEVGFVRGSKITDFILSQRREDRENLLSHDYGKFSWGRVAEGLVTLVAFILLWVVAGLILKFF